MTILGLLSSAVSSASAGLKCCSCPTPRRTGAFPCSGVGGFIALVWRSLGSGVPSNPLRGPFLRQSRPGCRTKPEKPNGEGHERGWFPTTTGNTEQPFLEYWHTPSPRFVFSHPKDQESQSTAPTSRHGLCASDTGNGTVLDSHFPAATRKSSPPLLLLHSEGIFPSLFQLGNGRQ